MKSSTIGKVCVPRIIISKAQAIFTHCTILIVKIDSIHNLILAYLKRLYQNNKILIFKFLCLKLQDFITVQFNLKIRNWKYCLWWSLKKMAWKIEIWKNASHITRRIFTWAGYYDVVNMWVLYRLIPEFKDEEFFQVHSIQFSISIFNFHHLQKLIHTFFLCSLSKIKWHMFGGLDYSSGIFKWASVLSIFDIILVSRNEAYILILGKLY